MRTLAVASLLLTLAACKKADMPPPAADTMANFAGTWNVTSYNPAGDSITAFTLVATSSDSGWTITFPGRPAVPVRVLSRGGDSVVTQAGPYESVLRRGVQVTTHGVFRVSGDSVTGTTHASYSPATGADSTLTVTSRGVRAPQ
jgi:hypothetical protein